MEGLAGGVNHPFFCKSRKLKTIFRVMRLLLKPYKSPSTHLQKFIYIFGLTKEGVVTVG
jgi:hypothetical protein